jgi:hypothetical protein
MGAYSLEKAAMISLGRTFSSGPIFQDQQKGHLACQDVVVSSVPAIDREQRPFLFVLDFSYSSLPYYWHVFNQVFPFAVILFPVR